MPSRFDQDHGGQGMTARDELAAAIALGVDGMDEWAFVEAPRDYRAEMFDGADAVIAAGWRKKPSRDAIRRAVLEATSGDYTDTSWAAVRTKSLPSVDRAADAILALMDGDSE